MYDAGASTTSAPVTLDPLVAGTTGYADTATMTSQAANTIAMLAFEFGATVSPTTYGTLGLGLSTSSTAVPYIQSLVTANKVSEQMVTWVINMQTTPIVASVVYFGDCSTETACKKTYVSHTSTSLKAWTLKLTGLYYGYDLTPASATSATVDTSQNVLM